MELISAFGTNTEAGTIHFIQYGFDEARARDTFDAAQYLANYADLRAAFGTDEHLATLHHIQGGFAEGRTDEAPISSASGATFIVADTSKENDLGPEVLPDLERTELADDVSYGWAEVFGQRVRTVSMDMPATTVLTAEPELGVLSAMMTREPLVDWFGGEATASAPLIASEAGQWMEAIADVSDLTQLPDAPYADLAADGLMPPDVTFEWRPTTDGQLEWSILQG